MDERAHPSSPKAFRLRRLLPVVGLLLTTAVAGAVHVKAPAPTTQPATKLAIVVSSEPYRPVITVTPDSPSKLRVIDGEGDLLHTIRPSQTRQEIAITPSPRQMLMEVTAYCACPKCCGPKAKGITASGKPVTYNDGVFVAADTRHLPFGTKIQIPGYAQGATVEVIDRGGAIKGSRLDVYFPTHEEALKWGRQRVWVDVLAE